MVKKRFIALLNINHTCKLQNCSLINQFTTVSLQLHVGETEMVPKIPSCHYVLLM
jgi:hypothetical protein